MEITFLCLTAGFGGYSYDNKGAYCIIDTNNWNVPPLVVVCDLDLLKTN
jgi:hypothetical protein